MIGWLPAYIQIQIDYVYFMLCSFLVWHYLIISQPCVCIYIFSCLDFLKDNHWRRMEFLGVLVMMVLLGNSINAYGAINQLSWREIENINNKGPYIGIVVPNAFELNPLLQSSSFVPHNKFPYFDFAGNFYNMFSSIWLYFYM